MKKVKIKKVDDKPMVIHTKEKTKIHSHHAKQASIKGNNVYTVSKAPKIKNSAIDYSDGKSYQSGADRIKVKARKQYRKSTVHDADIRENGISRFKRSIHESNASIKTKKTNLHIAGVTAAKATTDQLEGGSEVQQASAIAYELSRPAVGTASKGAELFKKQAIAAKRRKIKQVQAGKKLAKHSAKKAVTDASKKAAKETAKETAKESAKIAAKISAKAAGAAAGTTVGPEGTIVGYVVGEAAGQLVGEKLDQMDYKAAQRNRKIKFFLDKMKAENEQTDNLPKLLKDLAKRKAWMWVKSVAPAIGIGFLALVLIIFVAVIPVVTTTTVLYNSPFAILLPSLEEGDTVITVADGYVNDFKSEVQTLADNHDGYDDGEVVYVDYEGTDANPTNLYDIIAVYMVKHGVGETATIVNDTTKGWIKAVVDDMCSYTTSSRTETSTDSDGNEVTTTILVVNVSLKSYRDMISVYGFDADEVSMLEELMSPNSLEAMGYTGFESVGGNPGVCSLTEEEINAILSGITDSTQKQVLSYALHRVGYPYSQDLRDTGNYYDCSSLAYYSWKSACVDISFGGATTAAAEAQGLEEAGKTVSFSEMQPGDLIFYSYSKNGRYRNISHVAIYAGNGKLVEAKNEKYGVVYGDAKNTASIVTICRPN